MNSVHDHAERATAVRRGRLLEYLTIVWNLLEGIISIGAGLLAGGIALIGFGFDSLIEVSSGAALLWPGRPANDKEIFLTIVATVLFLMFVHAQVRQIEMIRENHFFQPLRRSLLPCHRAQSTQSPLPHERFCSAF